MNGTMKKVWLGLVLALTAPALVPAQTFNFAVTDLEGLEKLQREFGPFKAKLEELTGYKFNFFPVGSRTAAVEAMRSKKVDLVLTGPAEYVIFRQLANPRIVAGFSRPDYFTVVVVKADSPYDTLADLKGKKVAFGDVGSTSRHLAPFQVFKQAGIDPLKDLQRTHTAVKVGWEALKKDDVDAWATTSDKFASLRAAEKEYEPGAFRVLARGGDLPYDILVAGPHVAENVLTKIKEVLKVHSAALAAEIVKGEDNKKFLGMRFISSVDDKAYNLVREMYRSAGYTQFSQFIE